MTRTYDEDGQPMMSNKSMLKMLVKEIPVMYKDLRNQIQEVDEKLSKKIDAVSSDLRELRFKVDQNHTSFITNQMDMEKRIVVLEAR